MKPLDPKLYDQRTIRRNIENGTLKDEDYQKFLKSLPDDTQNAEDAPVEDEEPPLPPA